MNRVLLGLFIAAVIVMIPVGIYIQIGVWNECRTDHSFFYCVNLVSNH